ncbi:MAG: hypothetical protein ACTH31_09995, partial [Pseudoclavibacter sp.]
MQSAARVIRAAPRSESGSPRVVDELELAARSAGAGDGAVTGAAATVGAGPCIRAETVYRPSTPLDVVRTLSPLDRGNSDP